MIVSDAQAVPDQAGQQPGRHLIMMKFAATRFLFVAPYFTKFLQNNIIF
jgi:hypothetical protein